MDVSYNMQEMKRKNKIYFITFKLISLRPKKDQLKAFRNIYIQTTRTLTYLKDRILWMYVYHAHTCM